jgi:O-antigen ligase
VIAAGTLILTRSATVTIALVGVIIVAVAVLLVRRATSPRARAFTYAGLISVVLAGATLAVVLRGPLLAALGKSADFTGRFGIWAKVIDLAQQRPALGWGWVSYWVPWVAPFDNLAFRNGVRQLQAHNAWLDVWLQLGVVGLVVFAALVFSTLARSWSFAVDRPQLSRSAGKSTAESLLPLLLLAALLIQSIAESRLLVEFGMFFLILIAVKTKLGERADLPT